MNESRDSFQTQKTIPAVDCEVCPHADTTGGIQSSDAAIDHAECALKIVYLLSRYPAISHTFFLNEILELRKQGINTEVASINSPDRVTSMMLASEVDEANRTFYIKAAGATHLAIVAVKTLLIRPQVIARGVVAAFRLGRLEPRATVYAFFYLAEALILGDWMRARARRHLHIHFSGPVATVGMLTSIAWRFTYSLTVHGPDEFFDVEKFYLRQKIERARFVLCISSFCRSQLMRIVSPAHWEKMSVIRLGIDPSKFFPVIVQPEPPGVLEVLCVGRLVPAKGQLVLLRACELLHTWGYSLRVRLIGDGPDRKHLQAFAIEKGIDVIFEGARSHDDTRLLLEHADIFALASFAEGVPVALMEAMAMEIPCVSTRIAGIPELIRDGLDGLLVPASSVDELAFALQRLADDILLRRSLGAAGRKRVVERYNLPHNILLLAHVFRKHLSNSI